MHPEDKYGNRDNLYSDCLSLLQKADPETGHDQEDYLQIK